MTIAAPAPVINDVSLEQLYKNPYPVKYERLKKGTPVAWLAAVNLHLSTHFEDVQFIDAHLEIFPVNDSNFPQRKAIGHRMTRKDSEVRKAGKHEHP